MGNCCTFVRRGSTRRHIVLILIGLDNAGKTQTVNTLTGERDDKILPTVGFKAVNLVHKDTPVTIYDLGGSPQFRQIWPQYYSEVHGIIFVIDSSDFTRLEECKAVLGEVLSHDKISGKPVLILANKQDKQGALDDIDVVEQLNIEPLINKYRCPTLVESYTASANSNKTKLDPGLKAGYQWLLNYIVKRYGDINLRVQTDIHAELERRRRLSNKNLISQTVTELSEDQTGFENPNYESPDRKSEKESKPHPPNNSLNTTVTLETISNGNSVKPKLSPLFGTASDHASSGSRVELEARNNFRKLSPIVKKSVLHQETEFHERPQSSSSLKKHKIIHVVSKDSSVQEDNIKEIMNERCHVDGDLATWDESKARQMFNKTFDKTFLFHSHREIVKEGANRSALSAVTLGGGGKAAVGTGATREEPGRPASASQLVRRQLELAHHDHHKRRFSLKFIADFTVLLCINNPDGQRRKTNPWHAESAGSELEGGDCARATRLALHHNDFTM
ncbi:ADP-ribosylation factor-like protein 13B [Eumeta japonica]|uniref:ADP-ribosylation factor-like protein 13B n=1 Tax=Eumeta variegata TaxID=151549 RepID=A0A4C1SZA9_EUMVA|nr:ADP-ribosylation factor-like protein 13B [Eumeta japonica]